MMASEFVIDGSTASSFLSNGTTPLGISVDHAQAKKKTAALNVNSKMAAMSFESASEEKPAESIADIFSKRLRTLRKRLQKIEKNEEILALKAAEEARLKRTLARYSGATTPAGPDVLLQLNADQLKAIEKKEALLEIIKELEHMSEQVNDWQSAQPTKKNKDNPKKNSISKTESSQLSGAPEVSPSALNYSIAESRQEILHLWIALCRIDAVPTYLLSPEDFQGLKTLYSILHSLILAPEFSSGLSDIISWMHGKPSINHELDMTELLPPYKVVKYCVGKILSAPFDDSKLLTELNLSKDIAVVARNVIVVPEAKLETAKEASTRTRSTSRLTSAASQPEKTAAIAHTVTSRHIPPVAVSSSTSPFLSNALVSASTYPTNVVSNQAFGSYQGFLPSSSVFGLGGAGPITNSLGSFYNNGSPVGASITSNGHITFSSSNTQGYTGFSGQEPSNAQINSGTSLFFDGTGVGLQQFQHQQSAYQTSPPQPQPTQIQSSKIISPANHASSTPTPVPMPSTSATASNWTFPTDSAILRAGPGVSPASAAVSSSVNSSTQTSHPVNSGTMTVPSGRASGASAPMTAASSIATAPTAETTEAATEAKGALSSKTETEMKQRPVTNTGSDSRPSKGLRSNEYRGGYRGGRGRGGYYRRDYRDREPREFKDNESDRHSPSFSNEAEGDDFKKVDGNGRKYFTTNNNRGHSRPYRGNELRKRGESRPVDFSNPKVASTA